MRCFSFYVRNPHIHDMDEDVLYHFALGSGTHDLREMFGDVKVMAFIYRKLRVSRIRLSRIIAELE